MTSSFTHYTLSTCVSWRKISNLINFVCPDLKFTFRCKYKTRKNIYKCYIINDDIPSKFDRRVNDLIFATRSEANTSFFFFKYAIRTITKNPDVRTVTFFLLEGKPLIAIFARSSPSKKIEDYSFPRCKVRATSQSFQTAVFPGVRIFSGTLVYLGVRAVLRIVTMFARALRGENNPDVGTREIRRRICFRVEGCERAGGLCETEVRGFNETARCARRSHDAALARRENCSI